MSLSAQPLLPNELFRAKAPLFLFIILSSLIMISAQPFSSPTFSMLSAGAPSAGAPPISNSPVTITIGHPQFGFNVLPGSTRRVFASTSDHTTSNLVWKVKSGDAKLSFTSGLWTDVTIGPKGSSCRFTGNARSGFGVASDTQVVVEASQANFPSQTAEVTFNVCDPAVAVSVVPFYRTLYAGQSADVQSLIMGSVNQDVTWTVASQPAGGDGKLNDADKRDTVFSATVKGRYTLVATSVADPKQSSSAIMFVTGDPMPYPVTANLTEPVDCTVDPALKGKVYDVGPSQPFKTLNSVPISKMKPGSTVRLHNEDTTGTSPTTYHEYIQISEPARPDQPFRLCGVPDATGHLPIMDADHATGNRDFSPYSGGFGIITIHAKDNHGNYPNYSGPAWIAIEGIEVRNAKTGFDFTAPDGTPGKWTDGSAGIRIFESKNTSIVGVDIYNNGDGAFSDFNATSGWGASSSNALWEGSNIHHNGALNSYLSHQMYLQLWGEVVQFNRIDDYLPGSGGSNLKSRSVQTIIRYNYFGDGSARQMDLVDPQDSGTYHTFGGYLGNGYHANNPDDKFTADLLAAVQEAWNSHFVYGNIYFNQATTTSPIHFSYDTSPDESARKGTLYWYSNTFYEKLCPDCNGQVWTLFDTLGSGGNVSPQVEVDNVSLANNLVVMDDPSRPIFHWNNHVNFIATANGGNYVTEGWNETILGKGWKLDYALDAAYQGAADVASHVYGFNTKNVTPVRGVPFNPSTWIPTHRLPASRDLPPTMQEMPVRFSYMPALSYAIPRAATQDAGAVDVSAASAAH